MGNFYTPRSGHRSKVYRPQIFDLQDQEHASRFERLLNQQNPPLIVDEIAVQVSELIKCKDPRKEYSEVKIKQEVARILGEHPDQYGVWVWYPWLHTIVHLLSEEDFRTVRTNRNCYKITLQEQEDLSNLKVGIAGLSVGSAVATTLALEGTVGELRIADFDLIELSNLNRIMCGVQHIGLPKTVSVARRVAEIDPFLKVKCCHEGVTRENMNEFLTEGGKLDFIVDECDSLDIKILLRDYAKENQIPVVMHTSDRGMIDIERFDLEPDRLPLHGLVGELDADSLSGLSTEEKIPYILPMIGADKISPRLKASLMEVDRTIFTWPQLAADVLAGGGIVTEAIRLIALGKHNESGRYYVDSEKILGGKEKQLASENFAEDIAATQEPQEELTVERMRSIIEKFDIPSGPALDLEVASLLVEAAVKAPSAGNNQPWKWFANDRGVFLFHDPSRSGFSDVMRMGSLIAQGAATEMFMLRSRRMGLAFEEFIFPLEDEDMLVAALVFQGKAERDIELDYLSYLSDHIEDRSTNRAIEGVVPVSIEDVRYLTKVTRTIDEADLKVIDSANQLKELGRIIAETDRIRFITRMLHHEFYHKEVRWTDNAAQEKGDGLDLETVPLTASEIAGFKLAGDWDAVKLISNWNLGEAFGEYALKCMANTPAMGMISVGILDRENIFKGGRTIARMSLAAESRGVSIHPMMSPLLLFPQVMLNGGAGFTADACESLLKLYEEFREIFPDSEGAAEVYMFRLFKAAKPTKKAYRRNLNHVLHLETTSTARSSAARTNTGLSSDS